VSTNGRAGACATMTANTPVGASPRARVRRMPLDAHGPCGRGPRSHPDERGPCGRTHEYTQGARGVLSRVRDVDRRSLREVADKFGDTNVLWSRNDSSAALASYRHSFERCPVHLPVGRARAEPLRLVLRSSPSLAALVPGTSVTVWYEGSEAGATRRIIRRGRAAPRRGLARARRRP
jgi:hypothetical protein